jgi:hypothetical protein
MGANKLGIGLDEVVEGNMRKIEARKVNGTLHGSGDDR